MIELIYWESGFGVGWGRYSERRGKRYSERREERKRERKGKGKRGKDRGGKDIRDGGIWSRKKGRERRGGEREVLVIPRYAVTACETVTIYWLVFVVMSKEEGLCTVGSLLIPMILGRISTSSNSVEMYQQEGKERERWIVRSVRIGGVMIRCVLVGGKEGGRYAGGGCLGVEVEVEVVDEIGVVVGIGIGIEIEIGRGQVR